jgi:hypothetical protein
MKDNANAMPEAQSCNVEGSGSPNLLMNVMRLFVAMKRYKASVNLFFINERLIVEAI